MLDYRTVNSYIKDNKRKIPGQHNFNDGPCGASEKPPKSPECHNATVLGTQTQFLPFRNLRGGGW